MPYTWETDDFELAPTDEVRPFDGWDDEEYDR